jgi:hypothetical protein
MWVFFQTIEVETKYQSILPFLAGFSTKLVFGILNQAVIAIEMNLYSLKKHPRHYSSKNNPNNIIENSFFIVSSILHDSTWS